MTEIKGSVEYRLHVDQEGSDLSPPSTEESARQAEERYRRLFQTLTQAIVVQSADGTIVDANAAAEALLGLSRDEMRGVGTPAPHWAVTDENGAFLPAHEYPGKIAARTGKAVFGTVLRVFNRASGTTRWVSVDAIPQFRTGASAPVEVFILFVDITSQKLAEQELRTCCSRFGHTKNCGATAAVALVFGEAERRDLAPGTLKLPPRCRDILNGLAAGHSSKVIAYKLGISARTVEFHRAQLLRRLGARTAAEAVRIALEAERADSGRQDGTPPSEP